MAEGRFSITYNNRRYNMYLETVVPVDPIVEIRIKRFVYETMIDVNRSEYLDYERMFNLETIIHTIASEFPETIARINNLRREYGN